MGAYQRTIWPNGLPPLLRRAGDQRQYEALRAFYMDGLSSSVKVRGGTADPSGSSNRIANSPMLGQFRSVEIQAREEKRRDERNKGTTCGWVGRFHGPSP